MRETKEWFTNMGSLLAGLLFAWAMFQQYFPHQLRTLVEKYFQKLYTSINPYIQITFHESTGERFMRSEAYLAIENYLGSNSSKQAKRLKADMVRNSQALSLSMDVHEEVDDEFSGVKVWWIFGSKEVSKMQTFSSFPSSQERGFYKLTFHKRHRDLILGPYLNYVIKEGKAIKVRTRQRRLYTNSGSYWSHVVFEHPATFETLALEPDRKKAIIEDLIGFSQSEDFYARIGRAWKRGYLLYGPPGTGKSTMISAMANLLNYDVYDLELTAVKDNTELRRLLIETSSKAILVIEDIDCSLDLTGQRKKKRKDQKVEAGSGSADTKLDAAAQDAGKEEENSTTSKVTLSGLLNFIDGLWSACGGERIIVFTTNHIEKLDPALIRRGRMDLHIKLSYCSYEAFKVLAWNYLRIESHTLYATISKLLEEVEMTPADVAENMMPKMVSADATIYLKKLIKALEEAKEEAALRAIKEAKDETIS